MHWELSMLKPDLALWFQLAAVHKLHVRWRYCGSRAFGTNFYFLSVFAVCEKKNYGPRRRETQRECPGKLRAKSTNAWRKNIDRVRSGCEHSPVRAHTSTRSRIWAWRNHKTLTNLCRSNGLWRWFFVYLRTTLVRATSVFELCEKLARTVSEIVFLVPGLAWVNAPLPPAHR